MNAFNRASVSRETPVVRANSSDPNSGGKAFALGRPRPDVRQYQCQGSGCNPVNPGGLPQGGWPDGIQLLHRLGRKALHRDVVELFREAKTLLPAKRDDVSML